MPAGGWKALAAGLLVAGCGRLGFAPVDLQDSELDAFAPVSFTLPIDGGWRSVAVLADGSAIIVGQSNAPMVVVGDLSTPAGAGQIDAVIARVDAAGRARWVAAYGGTGPDTFTDVAVDGADNIYVLGMFSATASFGGSMLTAASTQDIVVASYGPDGAHRWSHRVGGGLAESQFGSDEGVAIAIAGSDVVIGGSLRGTSDFPGMTSVALGGDDEGFIARLLSSDGTALWVRRYGALRLNRVMDVAADASGDVYFSGYYEGNEDFGTGPEPYRGIQDAVVGSYGADGSLRWVTTFGGTGFDWPLAIAVARGQVFAAGHYDATNDLGIGTSQGTRDAMLVSLSVVDGSALWATGFGAANCDQATTISARQSDVLVTGRARGMISLDGTSIDTGTVDRGLTTTFADDGSLTSWELRDAAELDIKRVAHATSGTYVVGTADGQVGANCNVVNGAVSYLRRL